MVWSAPFSRVAGAVFSLAVGIALMVAFGCSQNDRQSPKSTVSGLFGAIADSDTAYIVAHVDLAAAAQGVRGELIDPSSDTTAVEPQWGERLLGAITGEGELRERWLANQIVLGEEFVRGDTAWVEVSFLDRL
ncbi:MAG TPA: hypothetical protein VM118_15330, partial [Acidobacteriota bacterium]|nr:hypothetical protein [Acidobacteriota bacterium]